MDTITSSSELKIQWEFTDGDTRVQSIKYPRYDLTDTEITSFATTTKNAKILIGDKTSAPLMGVQTAYILEKTTVSLDIS